MKGPRPITVYNCLNSRCVQQSQLKSLGTDAFLCLFLASCGTSFKILFDNGANFVGGVQERPLIICHLNWGTSWQISFPVQPHGLGAHSFFPLTNHLLYITPLFKVFHHNAQCRSAPTAEMNSEFDVRATESWMLMDSLGELLIPHIC